MGRSLGGKAAIITGAGSDIGRSVAQKFVAAGANVMLSHVSEGELQKVCKDLGTGSGNGKVAHLCCNLEQKLSVNNLLAATHDAFGRIDILVNAERHPNPGGFFEMKPGDLSTLLLENVESVFALSQAVAKKMLARAEKDPEFSGAIVNITSIAARRTVPELFGYSIACAALDQLTRSMASGLAEHRIRVNAVALGSVMTSTLRAAIKERSELREEMVRVTPLGRIGESDEAANAVLYLASDEASFITGQILAVDGGRTVLDPLASPVR